MRARILQVLLLIIAAVAIIAGGYYVWDQATRVSASDLQQVVRRDSVPFETGSIPDKILDRLAMHRVVLVGETHFLGEHTDFTFELLRGLHARGFRQFLFEWTQAADWALKDYVNNGELTSEWTVPHLLGDPIVAIREFNRTLPEEERIEVHAIDIHLADYGDTQSWLSYLDFIAGNVLTEPGPLTPFLQDDHDTYEIHNVQLEKLMDQLEDGRIELTASWGDYWFDVVYEMIEVELKGVGVRAARDSDYDESVRLREDAIKWLVDRRIKSAPQGTLINMGSTHAQKEGLWGTEDIEWLGEYLAHRSPVTKGSAINLWVPAAHIISATGDKYPDFDLAASPENELLRVISQTWPDQIVFLPLDDSLFSTGRVPINASGEIYVGAPRQHYDAVALLPLAHRDFISD